MKAVESRSEIYIMALQSLTKREREAIISRLLEDPELREDILDVMTIHQRQGEPSRPFREYLAEIKK